MGALKNSLKKIYWFANNAHASQQQQQKKKYGCFFVL